MSEEIRWGILGAATIAQKVCVAIKEASNASVYAVASREKSKAEAFIGDHCPGATAYGSYEELLADEQVQAVYIPLPTGMRAEWVLKAAAKKKHVLCEKPIAPNSRELFKILEACEAAGVQFMDNTMMMHGERWASMQKVLDDKEFFGSVRHVQSSFTLPCALDEDWNESNIRVKRALEPLGALGDLGWYCARFTLFALGYEDPVSVSCHFLDETSDGVPLQAAATLKFSGGRTASFDCSFKLALRQLAEITTDKCTLSLEDFCIPKADPCSYKISKGSFGDRGLFFPIEVLRTEEFKGKAQHTLLVEKMSSIAASGELEEFWPKVAKQTQVLLGALVASARKNGEWIKPRAPAAPRQREERPPQPEITKKKAQFADLASINPDSRGLNLQVKVVSDEAGKASVGDASGTVNFAVLGHPSLVLKAGASLVIRNASVKMVKGYIHVQVDKWGKVEESDEAFDFEPKKDKDISATEWELAKS